MNTAIPIKPVFTNIVSALFTLSEKSDTVFAFCSRLKTLPDIRMKRRVLTVLIF
jgi:hypothetical protein